jgi:hypothetical protein
VPLNLSPRELLSRELERRGRTWGKDNDNAITRMREEVALLHHRPMLRAVIMARHFGAKTSIGWDSGAYRSSKGSIDAVRRNQGT